MEIETFHQLLDKSKNPSKTAIDSLKQIVTIYPYFQAGIFAYLKCLYLHDYKQFEKELEHLSIFTNNRKALFYYILSDEYNRFFEQTGRKNISQDKTSVLLNAFFETHDTNEHENLEFEHNLKSSSLASLDYFTYLNVADSETKEHTLEVETKPIPLKHQGIIDSFIEKSEEEGGLRILINNEENTLGQASLLQKQTEDKEELDEDVFFTETLAKIYIKQKKYDKAYKIIKHLSLNYPKKNIYFADQLGFLEKLIINSKFKDTK